MGNPTDCQYFGNCAYDKKQCKFAMYCTNAIERAKPTTEWRLGNLCMGNEAAKLESLWNEPAHNSMINAFGRFLDSGDEAAWAAESQHFLTYGAPKRVRP